MCNTSNYSWKKTTTNYQPTPFHPRRSLLTIRETLSIECWVVEYAHPKSKGRVSGPSKVIGESPRSTVIPADSRIMRPHPCERTFHLECIWAATTPTRVPVRPPLVNESIRCPLRFVYVECEWHNREVTCDVIFKHGFSKEFWDELAVLVGILFQVMHWLKV